MSPRFVASLSSTEAAALHLPLPTPLALDVRSHGLIPEETFRVETRWVRPGGSPVRASVRGPFIQSETGMRRIPEPLFDLACSTAFSPPPSRDRTVCSDRWPTSCWPARRHVTCGNKRICLQPRWHLSLLCHCFAVSRPGSWHRSFAEPAIDATRGDAGHLDGRCGCRRVALLSCWQRRWRLHTRFLSQASA
jgi:hypothetical protein